MKNITIIIDGQCPQNVTAAQATQISRDWFAFTNNLKPALGARAALFVGQDALTSVYTRLRVASLRQIFKWEIGISDRQGVDESLLPAAQQEANIRDVIALCKKAYVCGNPIPPVDSYLPQGGWNGYTITALKSNGIKKVTFEQPDVALRSVVPNCTTPQEALLLLENGEDVILYINTDLFPKPTGIDDMDYPSGMEALRIAAAEHGYVWKTVNEI